MNTGDIVTIQRSDGTTMYGARIFTCYDNHVKVMWLKNKDDDMYYFKNISKKEILELNPQYKCKVVTFQISQEQLDAFVQCPDCPKIFFDAITN